MSLEIKQANSLYESQRHQPFHLIQANTVLTEKSQTLETNISKFQRKIDDQISKFYSQESNFQDLEEKNLEFLTEKKNLENLIKKFKKNNFDLERQLVDGNEFLQQDIQELKKTNEILKEKGKLLEESLKLMGVRFETLEDKEKLVLRSIDVWGAGEEDGEDVWRKNKELMEMMRESNKKRTPKVGHCRRVSEGGGLSLERASLESLPELTTP